MSFSTLRFLAVALLALAACQPPLMPDTGDLAALPLTAPAPADNPTTPAKVDLGRLLFWDPVLSGEKDVSCATCHHPDLGFADGRALSLGTGAVGLGAERVDRSGGRIPVVRRHAPTVVNAAFNGWTAEGFPAAEDAPMFWDHRLTGLEAQALAPLLAREEMRGDAYPEAVALDSVVARLAAIPAYREQFAAAFGSAEITATRLAQALASYERSLIAPNSRFDRYMRGESSALTDEERAGLDQFIVRGCATCHGGPMFSDFKLHRLGVAPHPALSAPDRGDGQDQFRTPTLRNVTRTAPYMHNGTQATLEEVMQFYNDQQSLDPAVANNELAPLFRDLQGMSNRRRDQIIAFLGALEDDPADVSVPAAVPSGLAPGGRLDRR